MFFTFVLQHFSFSHCVPMFYVFSGKGQLWQEIYMYVIDFTFKPTLKMPQNWRVKNDFFPSFVFLDLGLGMWPLGSFQFNWLHFLAAMLMTRMMKLVDKIILVYLTSFHSAQHQFAAHWVYKSRTITHLLFLIFLHLICW